MSCCADPNPHPPHGSCRGGGAPAAQGRGPGPEEIAEAIASITGQEIPPNPDAPLVAKLLQGALAGLALKAIREQDALPIKVRDVVILQDKNGNYEDHFVLITHSGIRLKVEVTPE